MVVARLCPPFAQALREVLYLITYGTGYLTKLCGGCLPPRALSISSDQGTEDKHMHPLLEHDWEH